MVLIVFSLLQYKQVDQDHYITRVHIGVGVHAHVVEGFILPNVTGATFHYKQSFSIRCFKIDHKWMSDCYSI